MAASTPSGSERSNSGGRQSGTRAARLAAVQALYEVDITGASMDTVLLEFLAERWKGLPETESVSTPDRRKFKQIIRGVEHNKRQLDEMIEGALAEDRHAERLDVLLHALLRAAVFELFSLPDVPARVVINEYVNLAHAFFSDREPALVNGVLDRLAHVLRQGELEPSDRDGKTV